MGDNYEALCNQGGPCQAKRSLMSRYVTPELRGCTANQTPRRGTKRMLTQALHHHAGMNAITRPYQCAVIFASPVPPCWLLNQHAQLPGKHCMEPEVARGCNQKLSHVHSNSKYMGLYQDKLEQSSKWTWQDRKWKRGRSLAFWSDFPLARRDGMRTPLPSILSRRVKVANANRLHLESQGRRPGENIHGKLLSSVWTSASQSSNSLPSPCWPSTRLLKDAAAVQGTVNSSRTESNTVCG